MVVYPGDYLCTDAQGFKFPCRPEVFAKLYEPVTVPIFGGTLIEQVVLLLELDGLRFLLLCLTVFCYANHDCWLSCSRRCATPVLQ